MRLRALVTWSVGLGLGLGLALGTGTSHLAAPPAAALSDEAVKARARDLGMRPLTELAGAEVTFTVGPNTTSEQLAQALQKAGLLTDQSDLLFHVAGKMPKTGAFLLRADQSVASLIALFYPS